MIYSTTNHNLHTKGLKEFVNWCEKVVGTGGHCFDACRIISANPLQNRSLEENSFSYSTNE